MGEDGSASHTYYEVVPAGAASFFLGKHETNDYRHRFICIWCLFLLAICLLLTQHQNQR